MIPRRMNFANLIDRTVPVVAELFATLASQDPLRMSFADIAGKTLLDIVEALRADGISQEAIAASLGLTMNGFRAKLKKLEELYQGSEVPEEARPKTLLERVYGHVAESPQGVTWAALTRAFPGVRDDTLRGVVHFLARYELLGSRGRGAARRFEVLHGERGLRDSYFDTSVLLFRDGPLTLAELSVKLGEPEATIRSHLDRLDAEGRLKRREADGGTRFHLDDYHIPIGTPLGFEAAIWDHIRVVFRAVSKKVRMRHHRSGLEDLIGGTTFSFDVPTDDPLYDEIASYLRRTRLEMEGWLEKVRVLEASPDWETRSKRRVTLYAGQMVEDLAASPAPGEPEE